MTTPLASELSDKHSRGPLTDHLGRQRGQRPSLAVDAVRGEPTRCRAGGEHEIPRGIEREGAGDRLSWYVTGAGQLTAGGIDREPGDAVVPSIADIEKPARRRQVDLRAGVAGGKPGGKRR